MGIVASLTVEIKGMAYEAEILEAADTGNRMVRLTSGEKTYDVEQGAERTTCSCADFKFRHADLPYSDGCKHVQAVVSVGLLANVKPFDATQGERSEASQPTAGSGRSVNLVEKYRPVSLADVVGQEEITFQLREWAEAPSETAFLFSGDTGVGKTSAALALANDLGCDVAQEELGGVYQIAAGNQLADDVRDMLRSLSLRPMFGSGWKVLVVNECDRMSEAVAYLWLDALESLPSKVVVVFSTNKLEKLPRRFVTRCEHFAFKSDVESVALAAQARVNEVWHKETGRSDAPDVASIPGAIEDGQVSIRACLQGLNALVRKAKATPRQIVQDAPERIVKTSDDGIDWHAYGRRYAAGESRSVLARELGVKETKFWNTVSKLGYKSPKKFYSAPKRQEVLV